MARGKEENTKKADQQKETPFDGIVFKVMPKEFFGTQNIQEKKPQAAAIPPVQAPAPPPPPVAPPAPKPEPPKAPVKRKRKKAPLILLLFGLIFLFGLSIAAAVVLLNLNQPEEPQDDPVQELPQIIPEVPTETPVLQVTLGIDTDSDGLTDREELLYGTDPRNPDTDGDTFLDGNEVFHLYDPLGYAPSTLLDTGTVVEFRMAEGGAKFTYPRQWVLQASENGNILLRAQTSATVTLERFEATEAETQESILARALQEEALTARRLDTKEGYEAYVTEDQRTAVVLHEGAFLKLRYTLSENLVVDYLRTFQMIINSIIFEEIHVEIGD